MTNSADPEKPTDLDLHCLQRQCISGFSRTRLKKAKSIMDTQSASLIHRYIVFLENYVTKFFLTFFLTLLMSVCLIGN